MLTAPHGMGPVGLMAGAILVILVTATAAVAGLERLRPALDLTEVRSRVRAWWGMAAVFLGALVLGDGVSLAFLALLSFAALREYARLLRLRAVDTRALRLAFLAIPLQYYWVATGWYGMFVIFIPVYAFLLLSFWPVLARDTKGFLAATSQIQWGLLAFVLGLSHLAFLLRLPLPAGTAATGRSLLLFLVFVVEASDVLQFLWGRTLGRRPILPRVSPNKTWEGAVGGLLTASLVALAIRFLTPFSAAETFLVALLVTAAGFCGGAVMSAIKRDFGVKDFGQLIPGHGGVLDRVDSLCWAAPLFFHYVRWCHT